MLYSLIIVEDEYEIRTGLSNYFPWSEIGFNVVGKFENGRQALEYIESNPVDAILCDIKMPIMSGLDLAHVIFDKKINIKMVLISGYREFDYVRTALKYGVKNYIVKPTNYNEVVEVFTSIKNELDEEKVAISIFEASSADRNNYNEQDEIIKTIKDYVIEHYSDATLEDAAKIVYMNPYYLSNFFKQKSGQKFSDFLTEIKMKKAAELLKDLSNKTYEVGLKVGYKNPKNFTRAFKKYYGKSPSEFKNSNKQHTN